MITKAELKLILQALDDYERAMHEDNPLYDFLVELQEKLQDAFDNIKSQTDDQAGNK